MAPSPSCSPGRTGPLWSRSCGPSLARTEVEDADVKEILFEISSSLVPCTILLNPAAAHWRGCATMRYTRTFGRAAVGSVSDDPPIGKPVRNLICHTGPVKLPARRSGLYGGKLRTKLDYSAVLSTQRTDEVWSCRWNWRGVPSARRRSLRALDSRAGRAEGHERARRASRVVAARL